MPHLPISFLLVLAATPAAGQFTQYVAPGSLSSDVEALEERLEDGARDARYRLGKLRIDPVLFVREAGYQSNVFGATDEADEISDFRLLVAAGLNSYLPLGKKALLAGFVTPEYSWWADSEDLRQFNLSAGAGIFAFFNRLSITADGRRLQQESPLSGEVTAPARIEEERFSVSLEVELRRSLFAFAGLRSSEYRYSGAIEALVEDIDLRTLDRDYTTARAGLRVELGPEWSLAAGVEDSETDFPFDPGNRSNDGSSPFAELSFEGNRVSAELSVFDTRLDFAAGSARRDFRASTGLGRVRFATPQRLDLSLYASRNLVFSVREQDSLIVEQRLGASIGRRDESRLSWLVFVESGDLEYSGEAVDQRVDDLTAFGVDLGYDLSRDVAVVLSYEESDYQSSLPEFDRKLSSLGLRLAFRDNLFPF